MKDDSIPALQLRSERCQYLSADRLDALKAAIERKRARRKVRAALDRQHHGKRLDKTPNPWKDAGRFTRENLDDALGRSRLTWSSNNRDATYTVEYPSGAYHKLYRLGKKYFGEHASLLKVKLHHDGDDLVQARLEWLIRKSLEKALSEDFSSKDRVIPREGKPRWIDPMLRDTPAGDADTQPGGLSKLYGIWQQMRPHERKRHGSSRSLSPLAVTWPANGILLKRWERFEDDTMQFNKDQARKAYRRLGMARELPMDGHDQGNEIHNAVVDPGVGAGFMQRWTAAPDWRDGGMDGERIELENVASAGDCYLGQLPRDVFDSETTTTEWSVFDLLTRTVDRDALGLELGRELMRKDRYWKISSGWYDAKPQLQEKARQVASDFELLTELLPERLQKYVPYILDPDKRFRTDAREKTQTEIARELGLGQSQVSRDLADPGLDGIRQLRDHLVQRFANPDTTPIDSTPDRGYRLLDRYRGLPDQLVEQRQLTARPLRRVFAPRDQALEWATWLDLLVGCTHAYRVERLPLGRGAEIPEDQLRRGLV